jgi:hypothetical protein
MPEGDESEARKAETETVSGFPEARTTSQPERLFLTIDLPANVERHLEPTALRMLKDVGERFLDRVLQEANQVAVDESQDAFPAVKTEHVTQGQFLALRRFRSHKGRSVRMLHFLRDIFIAALGAAAGLAAEHPQLAAGLALSSAVGIYLVSLWAEEE